MSNAVAGQFVWYELLTSDPKSAIEFYTDVSGWRTQPFQDDYTFWVGSQGPLGGTMTLPKRDRDAGITPHWMASICVDDVDATVSQVLALGGRCLRPGKEIAEVGRYAVIADPQGATLSVVRPRTPMATHDRSKPGEIAWNELLTTDQRAAFHFYNQLFGWEKVFEQDLGGKGTYLVFGAAGTRVGGMFTMPKESRMAPAWMYYVHVTELDAALDRAKAKGARLLNGPMQVPGGERIAQLADPQGAAFALHEGAKQTSR